MSYKTSVPYPNPDMSRLVFEFSDADCPEELKRWIKSPWETMPRKILIFTYCWDLAKVQAQYRHQHPDCSDVKVEYLKFLPESMQIPDNVSPKNMFVLLLDRTKDQVIPQDKDALFIV